MYQFKNKLRFGIPSIAIYYFDRKYPRANGSVHLTDKTDSISTAHNLHDHDIAYALPQ